MKEVREELGQVDDVAFVAIQTVFEGYSAKFLGIPPEETHSDWAKTGVDRAIIDSRLKIQSLWLLAWTIARPRKSGNSGRVKSARRTRA